jgi:hypothetical protein
LKENSNLVENYYKKEEMEGRYTTDFYLKYKQHCHIILSLSSSILDQYANYSMIGFGAAAKANTFLNFCKMKLEYIVDENPSKQGLYSPGMNIPIFGMDTLINDTRDLCIILLAWNFKDEIRKKIKSCREYMKKQKNTSDIFVVFYPKFEIFTNT